MIEGNSTYRLRTEETNIFVLLGTFEFVNRIFRLGIFGSLSNVVSDFLYLIVPPKQLVVLSNPLGSP